jgi:hypothetical protein
MIDAQASGHTGTEVVYNYVSRPGQLNKGSTPGWPTQVQRQATLTPVIRCEPSVATSPMCYPILIAMRRALNLHHLGSQLTK